MSEISRIIQVMIVDDHLVVREGLTLLIQQAHDMAVCASVGTPEEAISALEHTRPDVVILDLALSGATGLDLISSVLSVYPEARILVLSMHHENIYGERVLQIGAAGYIMKSEGHAKVLEGIREVAAGHTYVSVAMRERLWRQTLDRKRESQHPGQVLTDRELEVFHLLGQGLTTDQIAASLRISAKTIQTYRNNIKEKLGIVNAAELIHQATLSAQNQDPRSGRRASKR